MEGDQDNRKGAEDLNSDGSVMKKCLKPGDDYADLPRTGDETAIHYTCRVVGGGVLVTTKGKARKKVRVGDPQLVQGFSEALKTMRLNEVSRFWVRADKGYGEAGAPPKVPPNASIRVLPRRASRGALLGARRGNAPRRASRKALRSPC